MAAHNIGGFATFLEFDLPSVSVSLCHQLLTSPLSFSFCFHFLAYETEGEGEKACFAFTSRCGSRLSSLLPSLRWVRGSNVKNLPSKIYNIQGSNLANHTAYKFSCFVLIFRITLLYNTALPHYWQKKKNHIGKTQGKKKEQREL